MTEEEKNKIAEWRPKLNETQDKTEVECGDDQGCENKKEPDAERAGRKTRMQTTNN